MKKIDYYTITWPISIPCLKTQTILLCLIHLNQHNTYYHISITAVIRMSHYPATIWSVVVLW